MNVPDVTIRDDELGYEAVHAVDVANARDKAVLLLGGLELTTPNPTPRVAQFDAENRLITNAVGGPNVPPTVDDLIRNYQTGTSSSSGEVTLLTQAVTASKNFNLVLFRVSPLESPNRDCLARIKVDGVTVDSHFLPAAGGDGTSWSISPPVPIPIAEGGGSGINITITIEQLSGGGGVDYSATLWGFETDTPV